VILSKGVGIDLGTTNSAVAVMNPTDTEALIFEQETTKSPLTASCVWKNPRTQEILVGRKAFQRRGMEPEPVTSIKREMGREVTVNLSGEEKTPPEISAYILDELVGQISGVIEQWNGENVRWEVERSIVTIPAYFKQPAVDATRQAASLAGMELIELLHEPTAAATYYCWAQDLPNGVFMVYDLGGGTFDVSILRRTAGEFDVLGISGDNYLGGDDFDRLLAGHMIEVLSGEGYALDLQPGSSPEDALIFSQMCMLAEGVKKQLSSQGEVLVRDSMIADQDGSRMIIEMNIDRPTFESLIRKKARGTIDVCHEALEKAYERGDVSLSDVEAILLVGGSTWVPMIKQLVTEELCAGPDADGERAKCEAPIQDAPDTCVALGAAVRAAIHGLDVYDDGRTGRVHFRGQASTSSQETGITGDVTVFDDECDLGGGCIELVTGDLQETADLSEQGSFMFWDVPLEAGGATTLNFSVYDSDDNLVLAVGREVVQSDEARSMGGASTGSILAEPILLEVLRQGQLDKAELIPTGEGLPTDARHQFSYPGNAKQLRLTIYHGAIKANDVLIDVDPSTPQGTIISMEVHMDQDYLITVDGTVGEQEFTAQIEPPPPPEPPTEEDIARWREAFAEAKENLGAVEQVRAEAQLDGMVEDIEEAMATGDEACAVARKQEVDAAMAEWERGPVVLDPPWQKFEGLRHEVLNLVAQVEEKGIERFDADATREFVDAQMQIARTAYDNNDQVEYARAWQDLLERGRFIHGLLDDGQRDTPRPDPSQQAAQYAAMLESELQEVRDLAQAKQENSHDEKLDAIGEELGGMSARAMTEPDAVITDCRRIAQELEQIRLQLVSGNHTTEVGVPEVGVGVTTHFDRTEASSARPGESATAATEVMPGSHIDEVEFTVSAPEAVLAGASFLLQVWAHVAAQRVEVIERAQQAAGPDVELSAATEGPQHIERGTTLSVEIALAGMTVAPREKPLLWTGEIGKASFRVKVPDDIEAGEHHGEAIIRAGGLEIMRMFFAVTVGERAEETTPLHAELRRHRRAFASYARENLKEVTHCLQGMETQNPSLQIFLDVLELRPGDDWRTEIKRRIDESDILYLFWSRYAAMSEWVDWEWRLAFDRHGPKAIDPVPLESPDSAKPPSELEPKHFDARWNYLRAHDRDRPAAPE
ncbi:MAG: Hsp70 family protein, partial [Armatimonadota bacterium]